MTKEQIALARRAVACKGWRWARGMSNDQGQTIDCVDLIPGKAYCGEWDADMTALPDLEDPATLGCLLALVRESLNSPRVHVLYVEGLYRWECADNRTVHGVGATEAEALIETLEYAP